jgi:hypothetical protein
MPPADTSSGGMELDDFVRAYEAAWACVERADLRAFLPEPGHPLYVSVLRAVVRVDLQFRWVIVHRGSYVSCARTATGTNEERLVL